MRWIWIDRIVELERAKRCVAIKNVSLAEDVLHDHFPAEAGRAATPIMPAPLIIEGMAQTAGILVGHANDFAERVILAKIARATFSAVATPGHTLRHTAILDRIDQTGASTSGQVELIDPATGDTSPLGRVDLMFSHIDSQRTGIELPDHNFVFTGEVMNLVMNTGLSVTAEPNKLS